VIKLRIIGTPGEIERSLESVEKAFAVLETSRLYPCRTPDEDKVRVYLTVDPREVNPPDILRNVQKTQSMKAKPGP
jgi:hypothetical protein